MQYPVNDYLLYIIKKETTERFRREAAIDHLVAQINPRQSRGLGQQICRMLHNLGHMLMNLGQRLEHLQATQGV